MEEISWEQREAALVAKGFGFFAVEGGWSWLFGDSFHFNAFAELGDEAWFLTKEDAIAAAEVSDLFDS